MERYQVQYMNNQDKHNERILQNRGQLILFLRFLSFHLNLFMQKRFENFHLVLTYVCILVPRRRSSLKFHLEGKVSTTCADLDNWGCCIMPGLKKHGECNWLQ